MLCWWDSLLLVQAKSKTKLRSLFLKNSFHVAENLHPSVATLPREKNSPWHEKWHFSSLTKIVILYIFGYMYIFIYIELIWIFFFYWNTRFDIYIYIYIYRVFGKKDVNLEFQLNPVRKSHKAEIVTVWTYPSSFSIPRSDNLP